MIVIITHLEKFGDYKTKVYIDDEYCFLLTNKQIYYFTISVNNEISQEQYEIIYSSVLKSAKIKALNILKRMDRTESELRQKLNNNGYSNNIVDKTIEYINNYHYIDDYRYAKNYFEYKRNNKSTRAICMELTNKGVSKEIISSILETDSISDIDAIRKIINKKTKNVEYLTQNEKQKLYTSLIRKGFNSSLISKELKSIDYTEYIE